MAKTETKKDSTGGKWIYTPYITKNGKRIYPKKRKAFKFWVDGPNLKAPS